MPIFEITDESLQQAADILCGGGLVAFPTETVYGLGADAYNPSALVKIFEAKGRPRFDPLIVHIAATDTLEKIADLGALNTAARKNLDMLIRQFWPGPLTIILPRLRIVPDIATSGLPTVAVRFPAHSAARQLITLSTGAVAAPSANPFGYLSPTRAEHVLDMLGEKVAYILDGGPTQVGLESTVLDICHGQYRILRPGGIPKEAIESLLGPVAGITAGMTGGYAGDDEILYSPGMLKTHYAPNASLTVHDLETLCGMSGDKDSAFVFFDGVSRDVWLSAAKPAPSAGQMGERAAVFTLSEKGYLPEAAAQLFEVLHALDQLDVKQIRVQLAPEEGLGAAINDRLRRAAAR